MPSACPFGDRFRVGRDRLFRRPTFKVVREHPRGRVPLVRLQSHGLQADGFQCRVNRRVADARPWEFPGLYSTHDLDELPFEGRLAGQNAIERRAEL